ncbi:MAG TPA: stage III sporulation protein AE, partial [Syntrophomonas sp.]|nr:stage III sporulation protein AE [Syntrophomonas sp.]
MGNGTCQKQISSLRKPRPAAPLPGIGAPNGTGSRPQRNWARRVGILLLSLLLFMQLWFLTPVRLQAQSEAVNEISTLSFTEGLEQLDLQVMEEYKHQVDSEISNYMQGVSLKQWIIDFVQGKWEFNWSDVMKRLLQLLMGEVVANSGLLVKLLVLCVLSALLMNLQQSFSTDVARISYLACYLALVTLAVASFKTVLDIGQGTISNMVGFMTAMLPQMLVLTAGLGGVNSAAMLFPMLMTTATALGNAINSIVFPLIILSAVVSIMNNMSESIKLQRLGKFFTQIAQVALGFFLTLFVGILTMRALYASVLDKTALRATRFVSDNALPVIGKMFSDTIEVAAGYVVMLKQALGVLGVLIILAMIIMPVVKVTAIALIYKVAAALAEPLGDSRTAAVLESPRG